MAYRPKRLDKGRCRRSSSSDLLFKSSDRVVQNCDEIFNGFWKLWNCDWCKFSLKQVYQNIYKTTEWWNNFSIMNKLQLSCILKLWFFAITIWKFPKSQFHKIFELDNSDFRYDCKNVRASLAMARMRKPTRRLRSFASSSRQVSTANCWRDCLSRRVNRLDSSLSCCLCLFRLSRVDAMTRRKSELSSWNVWLLNSGQHTTNIPIQVCSKRWLEWHSSHKNL